ncbi:hypothetical protein RZ58_00595 [[Haemophilus] ducreyi]|nr:hypothetical protein RZ58_00595 [[Haemophilus] ducreyi]
MFESCFADCNSYLCRDDGSLVELHQHNNYGRGLSDEELDCLERDGVGDFGFEDFCDEIEYAINVELNHRQKIKKDKLC